MKLKKTIIPGCYEIEFPAHPDKRGTFVKSFHKPTFAALGLETDMRECFYTFSEPNVLRGMHFQLPPEDGAKLVYCLSGELMDVALDLRRGSPTYGQSAMFVLEGGTPTAAYIPRGVAHGFYVRKAPAIVMYQVTSVHHPELDTGILWNSFGLEWPCKAPVLSARDERLPKLAEFQTPFIYEEGR
jgi:dTDP-4-dehydrorhamnose 3,5-epimerase